jgi:DNA-directed RNA polymerase specialized sigma24 family protein
MNAQTIELTDQEGYELFRHAIVGRDSHAWAVIYTRYRSLLRAWAYRFSGRFDINEINECCDDLADQAFARAWAALAPERFGQFPTLSSLLAYLRSCVSTAVIDCARAQAALERKQQRLELVSNSANEQPENMIIRDLERVELWRIVNSVAKSTQDRIILIESFVLDFSPSMIYARHGGLFENVSNVYSAKRNLLDRLQHNRDLQQLRGALWGDKPL